MAGTTTNYSLPYPESTDLVASYPALGQDLAEDLDTILAGKLDTSAYTPGLSLITTQSFSAVSSVSVNNCFSGDYDNYRVVLTGTCSSNTEVTRIRLRASGSDATGSNYSYQYWSPNGAVRETAQTSAFFSILRTTATGSATDLYRPNVATDTMWTTLISDPADNPQTQIYTGRHNVSSSYDGFTLFVSSGSITGSVSVYGYKK